MPFPPLPFLKNKPGSRWNAVCPRRGGVPQEEGGAEEGSPVPLGGRERRPGRTREGARAGGPGKAEAGGEPGLGGAQGVNRQSGTSHLAGSGSPAPEPGGPAPQDSPPHTPPFTSQPRPSSCPASCKLFPSSFSTLSLEAPPPSCPLDSRP